MASRQEGRKRQAWEVRFGQFRTSWLTVARFCEQEGVSANTFYYWAKRVGSSSVREGSGRRPRAFFDIVAELSAQNRSRSLTSSGGIKGTVAPYNDPTTTVARGLYEGLDGNWSNPYNGRQIKPDLSALARGRNPYGFQMSVWEKFSSVYVNAAPIAIGLLAAAVSGPLGFAASGAIGGALGGGTSMYVSSSMAGNSGRRVAEDVAVGAAAGGLGGYAGGAVLGRFGTSLASWSGGGAIGLGTDWD